MTAAQLPQPLGLRGAAPMRTRARFGDLYAAEWIKLWSLRSTSLTLGAAVALALYFAGSNSAGGTMLATGPSGPIDPNHAAFDGPSWIPSMIGVAMIGALALVGEHASGLIRTTLVAIPERRRLVVAKAGVLASVTAATALVAAVGGLLLAFATTPGDLHGRSLTDPASLDAIGASVAVLPVCALTGMALGALLRHAAATGFAVCAVLGFGPLLIRPDGNRLATDLANVMPYYAWGRLTSAGRGSSGTMTAGEACLILAAWALASIVVTAVVLDRRDV
ncbi:ABC transporter permease [Streptacidiphilus sp. N1-10]|uniref:ABC transporter permease n=1 Tax=Streptacidiphilus jeojiensis TaxID=3229225 RepID=A0ABV6XLA3_9ACTN